MTLEKIVKLSTYQKSIARHVSKYTTEGNWKDYTWQLKHSIQDVDTFEKLTEIKFTDKEHEEFKKTVSKFPMSCLLYTSPSPRD